MPVKVIDLINLYIGYQTAQQVNTRLSTRFAYSMHKNMPLLQKEADFWNQLTVEDREKIAEMEVTVDLHKINQDDLPEFSPVFTNKGSLEIFSPVLADYVPQQVPEESLLSKLLATEEVAEEPDEQEKPKNKAMKKA